MINVRCTLACLGMALLMFGLYLVFLEGRSILTDGSLKLRDSHVELQHLEQQKHHLENPQQRDLLSAMGEGATYLKIGIDEYMKSLDSSSELSLNTYEMHVYGKSGSEFPGHSIDTLRVSFNLVIADALKLTEFYSQLTEASLPWPSEIRACEIDRLDASDLLAKCIFDVYHWADL